jgi:hypothetical protein
VWMGEGCLKRFKLTRRLRRRISLKRYVRRGGWATLRRYGRRGGCKGGRGRGRVSPAVLGLF